MTISLFWIAIAIIVGIYLLRTTQNVFLATLCFAYAAWQAYFMFIVMLRGSLERF